VRVAGVCKDTDNMEVKDDESYNQSQSVLFLDTLVRSYRSIACVPLLCEILEFLLHNKQVRTIEWRLFRYIIT